jgi:hypothetical protein
MKKQLGAVTAAIGLSLALAAPTLAGDPSQWGSVNAAGDPSQWGKQYALEKVNEYEGQHRRGIERKVNEYEGQHRTASRFRVVNGSNAMSTVPSPAGQDPEFPVTPN